MKTMVVTIAAFALLTLAGIFAAVLWEGSRPNDPLREEAQLVAMSVEYYQERNDGQLPEDIQELVPEYFIDGGEEMSRRILAQYDYFPENQHLILERKEGAGKEARSIAIYRDGRIVIKGDEVVATADY